MSGLLTHERRLVTAIALLGALRVFFFGSAFPLFNNVDEPSHFDTVYKYAHGIWPHADTLPFDERSGPLLMWFWSTEYNNAASDFPSGAYPPPPWSVEPREARRRLAAGLGALRREISHEVAQPPVYYALAAAWWKLGETLGLGCGDLIYWLRWLNVPLMAALVWLAWALVRESGRDDPWMRLGVPLLVAVFPQDVFYSISNDSLSPLLAALALWLIVRAHAGDRASGWIGAGLATALAMGVKYTNAMVLPAAAALLLASLLQPGRRARGVGHAALFGISALIPVGLWMARNVSVFGDPTGMGIIAEYMGWPAKPLSAYLDHPLFTPWGVGHFLHDLARDFWRGRFKWGGEFLAHPFADGVYVISSGLFLAAAAWSVGRRTLAWLREPGAALLRPLRAEGAAFLTVCSALGILAFLSLPYDWPVMAVPSKADPFMTVGRLASGCIVPFAVAYMLGLRTLASLLGQRRRGLACALTFTGVIATVTISELAISVGPVRSAYNWFHLEDVPYGPCAATRGLR